MAKQIIPHCVGCYDAGDPPCDGEPEGGTKQEAPCRWRDRCLGFKLFLAENDAAPEDYIEETILHDAGEESIYEATPEMGHAQFIKLCDDKVKAYGIKDGRTTKDPNRKRPLKKRTKDGPDIKRLRASAKRNAELCLQKRMELKDRFDEFKDKLAELLHKYRFITRNQTPPPGRLYVVDRLKNSRYMSIYCASPNRNKPICMMRFKPRLQMFDILLPITADEFTAYVEDKYVRLLAPEPIADGMYKCIIKNVGKEKLLVMTAIIANFINTNKLNLPKAA